MTTYECDVRSATRISIPKEDIPALFIQMTPRIKDKYGYLYDPREHRMDLCESCARSLLDVLDSDTKRRKWLQDGTGNK